MKIWKLVPVKEKRDSGSWQGSVHHGWVRVRAKNEARAREIAWMAFENTHIDKTVHLTEWATLPWNDPTLVECFLAGDDISNEEGILDIE